MSATVIVDPPAAVEAPPRRLGKLVLLALLLLALAGAGVWWLLLAGAEEEAPAVDGEIVTLDPMTTTVGEAALHHARVAVAVVLVEGQDPTVVEPRAPLLKDALLRELARMDGAQVRSADGSDALRAALSAEARDIWGEEVVRRVVLTELLIN